MFSPENIFHNYFRRHPKLRHPASAAAREKKNMIRKLRFRYLKSPKIAPKNQNFLRRTCRRGHEYLAIFLSCLFDWLIFMLSGVQGINFV